MPDPSPPDAWWKALAVHLAAMEQLFAAWDAAEGVPRLDPDTLFLRARYLYEAGHLTHLAEWRPIPPGPTPAPGPVPLAPAPAMKRCVCGEDVRATWPLHRYKQDGTPCGHRFPPTS